MSEVRPIFIPLANTEGDFDQNKDPYLLQLSTEEDLSNFTQVVAHEGEHITRFGDFHIPGYGEILSSVERPAELGDGRDIHLGLWEKQLVGGVSLYPEDDAYLLQFWLEKNAQHSGKAALALSGLKQYLRAYVDHKIQAKVSPENKKATATLTRSGFSELQYLKDGTTVFGLPSQMASEDILEADSVHESEELLDICLDLAGGNKNVFLLTLPGSAEEAVVTIAERPYDNSLFLSIRKEMPYDSKYELIKKDVHRRKYMLGMQCTLDAETGEVLSFEKSMSVRNLKGLPTTLSKKYTNADRSVNGEEVIAQRGDMKMMHELVDTGTEIMTRENLEEMMQTLTFIKTRQRS